MAREMKTIEICDNEYEVVDGKARPVNNVAEMKAIPGLVEGNIIKTIGYYSANDGGGAIYLIRKKQDTDVEDMGVIHFINDTLVAELIIKDNTVNVLQFGAKADNETNDTEKFNNAMKTGCKIIVPKKQNPYLVSILAIKENITIEGINFPQINIKRNTEGDPTSNIQSNSKMKNLHLNCINESMKWSRFGIENVKNIVIENCKFEGFRENIDAPCAWGIYIDKSKNIVIDNCEFENNSQSDIAILDNVEELIIDNCKGSALHFNFEPNGTGISKNITVKNCLLNKLTFIEYSFDKYLLDNITVENCTINILAFKGGNINFINTKIKGYNVKEFTMTNGGKINTINSLGFAKNLNNDPTFKKIVNTIDTTDSWKIHYSPDTNAINVREDNEKGRILELNPNQANTIIVLSREFIVEQLTVYAIRTLMNSINGTGSIHSGQHLRVEFYNASNELIGNKINICIDRNIVQNNESEWAEKTAIIKTPENCVKLKILLSNTKMDATSYTKVNIGYLLLNKIIETNTDDKNLQTYSDSPNTSNNVAFGEKVANIKGDKIYSKDPLNTGCEGFICVSSGNPGAWKKTGVIADIS